MDAALLSQSPSSSVSYSVTLEGGPPWGIRLQGGYEFSQKLRVAKVNPNSKAYCQGVQTGDVIDSINGQSTDHMSHEDALWLFKNSNDQLVLKLTRSQKQSAVPVIRVESPTGRRKSESDFLQSMHNSQFGEVEFTARIPSQSSHNRPSAAVWSPAGYSQMKTYQPVHFDSSGQNRHERRTRNSAPVKEFESANEILDSQLRPLSAKPTESPDASARSKRRRHPRHISDPGFVSKAFSRPPISDNIQLSRRSRQFNIWHQLYPRNFSDPSILVSAELASHEPDPSKLPRPQVFTSIDEFQKHYGSCYARIMPQKKRYSVKTTNPPSSSAPSSPSMKRVQFAPVDGQTKPLHSKPSGTIARSSPGKRTVLSSPTPFCYPAHYEKEEPCYFSETEVAPTNFSLFSPETAQPVPESLTSSLIVKLTETDGSRMKKEEDADRDLMIIKKKKVPTATLR